MKYIIDPAAFSDGQWEELYNASAIIPRTMEARHSARPINRTRKQITLAVAACRNRSEQVSEIHGDPAWAVDLSGAADILDAILPYRPPSKREATKRVLDILNMDIYTDAPEYADRIEELQELLLIVFSSKRVKAA